MNKEWYVVHTHRLAEDKARDNLERQGFEVYLPVVREIRKRAHEFRDTVAPLFPSYLFTRFCIENTPWKCVDSTYGVRKLVRFGAIPLKIPRSVVEEIMAREDDSGLVQLVNGKEITKGQPIKIVGSKLCDLEGVFERPSGEERAIVLLSMLNRTISVNVPSNILATAV